MVDPGGAVISNAEISVTQLDTGVTRTAVTDDSGHWVVSGLPSGRLQIRTNALGFRSEIRNLQYDANSPTSLSFGLFVASANETVTVVGETGRMQTQSLRIERDLKKQKQAAENAASQNVFNLQQRVAGVLPVRFDVPRAGKSYRFVRPLVLDEETRVTFSYKTR